MLIATSKSHDTFEINGESDNQNRLKQVGERLEQVKKNSLYLLKTHCGLFIKQFLLNDSYTDRRSNTAKLNKKTISWLNDITGGVETLKINSPQYLFGGEIDKESLGLIQFQFESMFKFLFEHINMNSKYFSYLDFVEIFLQRSKSLPQLKIPILKSNSESDDYYKNKIDLDLFIKDASLENELIFIKGDNGEYSKIELSYILFVLLQRFVVFSISEFEQMKPENQLNFVNNIDQKTVDGKKVNSEIVQILKSYKQN